MGESQRSVPSQHTPTLAAQPAERNSPFDTLASAPHSQLLALGLVVAFLGGGLWILRLRPRFPKDASSKASKKRRQAALNRIIQAQEAAQSTSSAASPSDDTGKARGLRDTLKAPLAAAADYLPSPSTSSACIASTSAAILSGLERIGSAASGAFSVGRRKASAKGKGKERLVEETQTEEPPRVEGEAVSSALQVQTVQGEGSTRRGRGKKGKGAQTGGGAGGGGLPSPSLSHSQGSRPHSPKPVMREVGVSCAGERRVETSDAGVQTDPHEVEAEADSQRREDERVPQIQRLDSDPTPRSDSPPRDRGRARAGVGEDPPPPDDPPSVPSLPRAEVLAAPAPRPPILPIPFDLHASFRSTPTDTDAPPPTTAHSSSASSSSYPPLTSPPLSPSRSPSSTIPSTSSPSGSPTSSRRANSPTTRRRSSAVEVTGHLAVASSASGGSGASTPASSSASASAEGGKSRKAQRKSSAVDSSGTGGKGGGGGVVGMPNAIAAPRKSPSATPSTPSASSSPRTTNIPLSGTGGGRRTSTASSSAGSSSTGGFAGGVAPLTAATAGGERTVRPAGAVRKRSSLQGLGVEIDRAQREDANAAGEGQAGRDGYTASSSSPVVPATAAVPNGLAVPGAGETEDAAAGSPPGRGIHPLAWLDLDAVSFSNPRPLGPPRSPQFLPSPKSSNNRRRNSRQSYQPNEPNGIGRRRSNGKRKTSAPSPTLAIPPATADSLSDDDDDVVIVLDAPLRHRPVPRRSPSRRSSYVGDDEALDQDGSSLLDEDEIPSIDIDEGEPIAGGAVVGESEDGLRLHPEYIGFLPSYLSHIPFGTSPALLANGHASSVPSFVLDVSPTLEPVEFAADSAKLPEVSTAKLEVPTPEGRDSPEDAPTPIVKQGHGVLPMIDASPPLVNGLSEKSLTSPVESGEPTPRVAFPPSPPEDTADNYLTKVVKPASPVDVPLPSSPDLAPTA